MGPQERLNRILDLARDLVVNGDERARDSLRQEIETHDMIERHLNEVFSARSAFIVDQRAPTAFTRPNP